MDELEYLGYKITCKGDKSVLKKITAILEIKRPKTRKQLRSFIGMVNYYRDMWIRRSHLLAPLSCLTSKDTTWRWTDIEQKAFDDIKRVMAKETLLHYPDFNQPFEIHTDASARQLGAVISQNGKPIAFYSRKLRDGQKNYSTTEREMLAIIETLKEFRTILFGQQIKVYTDHKNLTFDTCNTERVMRWRMVLEEYGPELIYIKGEHNLVADALSRLDLLDDAMDEVQMLELLAFEDEIPPSAYPLQYSELQDAQMRDTSLQGKISTPGFAVKRFHGGGKHYDAL